MAEVGNEEQADLNKLKVNDLKKMLKARGLSVVGNKQELIDRLQSSEAAAEALLEGSEVGDIIDEDLDRELDESALDDEPTKDAEEPKEEEKLSEPPKEVPKADGPSNDLVKSADQTDDSDKLNGSSTEEKPQPPKHKRITITDITVADADSRKKARLERFNQAASDSASSAKTPATDALAKRAARFSQDSTQTAAPKVVNDPLNSKKAADAPVKAETDDKLKKRAERFGILSPAEAKKQQLEKLQARKARFASAPAVAAEKTTAPPLPAIKTASTVDEKKRLRAERFKIKV